MPKIWAGPSAPLTWTKFKRTAVFPHETAPKWIDKKYYYEGNDGDAKDGRVDGRSKQMRIAQRRL